MSTKLDGSKYCYVSLTVQLNISHLFTHSWMIRVQFQIQFSINYLFAHSLNVKEFYLTHKLDPIRCYHSGLYYTWERWQWRGTPDSLKLQHYWSLTSVCLVDEGYLSAVTQSVYSTAPDDWNTETWVIAFYFSLLKSYGNE